MRRINDVGGMQGSSPALTAWRVAPLSASRAEAPNLRSRWIIEGRGEAPRPDVALVEWELRGAGWQDRHPHAEINYVLEGELHVEADGQTVVLGPGDCVRIAPGETGRYWAPTYARMLGVYGANPDGAPTDATEYWEI
jgi:quercetin dioxygenase-like cupin family protein